MPENWLVGLPTQHFPSNRQRVLGVAEVVRFHAHAVHEGDVEAAEFAVFVFAEVVEAAALGGAAATAGEDD